LPRSLLYFFLGAAFAVGAPAASTTTWELNSWQDLIKGKFTNVALGRDGRLAPSPALTLLADTGQPAVWSVIPNGKGGYFAATGHRGRVYAVTAAGQATLLWTAPEPEIFALATSADGTLYAASSPDGKIYRLDASVTPARATVVFAPQARYIWSLAVGADGTLYAGTGDQGKVFAIRNNAGEVWYESGQAHVTSLKLDAQGRLLAGTEPNGILYRISGKEKAFVLYDSSLPEVRAVSLAADGSIYAAGLGGALARRTAAVAAGGAGASSGAVTAPGTSITVTEDAQAGNVDKSKTAVTSTMLTSTPLVAAAVEMVGVEKSALYRIAPDNTVETIWTSKEENIFDLYEARGEVTFATDLQGRIYRLNAQRQLSLLGQTAESEVTRLLPDGEQVLAATSNSGKLFRLGAANGQGSVYESPVHDANTVARWGKLTTRGSGTLKLLTRSGNSARPDKTWSDWTAPGAGGQMSSPNARYLQWKAEWNGTPAVIESARAAYLPQNTAPAVKTVSVIGQTMASTATTTRTGTQVSSAASATYSITVTDTGEASTPSTGTPTQTITRTTSRQLVITWSAEDADADPLLYSLHYRAEDEKRWKLLRAHTAETAVTLDSEIFVDGRYLFRVTASDKAMNAGESAREAELVSAPVLVDNTPPVLDAPKRTAGANGGWTFEIAARDATSELKRCEYSLDGGAWTLLEAADGVTDSLAETFTVAVAPPVAAGEHVVVFRVTDQAGNTAARKVAWE